MSAPVSVRACALCGRAGDFGPLDPADPHSGRCPECVAAGRPTREGLEQAVVIVAVQALAEAETVNVAEASPETLVYQVGALRCALRSVLQLLGPEGERREAGR